MCNLKSSWKFVHGIANHFHAEALKKTGFRLKVSTARTEPNARPCKMAKTQRPSTGLQTQTTLCFRCSDATGICRCALDMSFVPAKGCHPSVKGTPSSSRQRRQNAMDTFELVVGTRSVAERRCRCDHCKFHRQQRASQQTRAA